MLEKKGFKIAFISITGFLTGNPEKLKVFKIKIKLDQKKIKQL